MDWKQIISDVEAWLGQSGPLQKVALAAGILVGGWILAKVARGLVRRTVMRAANDATLANFTSSVAGKGVQIVAFIAAIGALGVDTTSLAALIGGAGVAIGFALRDTLGNLAAGVMLILFRPFNQGDVIDAAGVTGKVEEITIASTRMTTPDNKSIIVPNGAIFGAVITNLTEKDTRRVDLVAGIGYEDDQDKAKEVLEAVLRDNPKVLADPAPAVALIELADSSVNFNVRPWAKTEDYWDVYSEVTSEIKRRFDAAGISIPYPQQDVHMHNVA